MFFYIDANNEKSNVQFSQIHLPEFYRCDSGSFSENFSEVALAWKCKNVGNFNWRII